MGFDRKGYVSYDRDKEADEGNNKDLELGNPYQEFPSCFLDLPAPKTQEATNQRSLAPRAGQGGRGDPLPSGVHR